MKSTMKVMLATVIVAMLATSAPAAEIIFSSSNTNPTAGIPAQYNAFNNKTLYLWVHTTAAATDVTPHSLAVTGGVPDGSAGFAVNIARATNVPYAGAGSIPAAVLSLTGAKVDNPAFSNVAPATNRWQAASDYTGAGATGNVTASLVTNLNATTVSQTSGAPVGVNSTNPGGNTQPATVWQSDGSGGAYLLHGSLTFTTSNYGTSDLAFQASALQIVRSTGANTTETVAYTLSTSPVNVVHLLGDADADGLVTLNDALLSLSTIGSPSTIVTKADEINVGGPITLNDALVSLSNIGNGTGQVSVVPEPSSICLLAIGTAMLLGGGLKKIRSRRVE